MSTPYVGLKSVFQQTRFTGESPWVKQDAPTPEHTGDARREAKRRLIRILETQLGVQTIQIGAFHMRLSEDVPERHLLKATYYLLQQMKEEAIPSPHIEPLETCLVNLLQTPGSLS